MTIGNLQHFLVENEEAILSIPSLAERLERIEDHIGLSDSSVEEFLQDLEALDEPEDTELIFRWDDWNELFADDGASKETFDQDDHDELFADSGATERSFSGPDFAEIFPALPVAADPTINHPNI